MDWDEPAIILAVRAFGEADAVAAVMTEKHGVHRGLARGGQSRARAALWQTGNLAQIRWVGRLSDQLGSFSGELIHATAALAMDDALRLAMLSSVCAVAEGALPEREPHPRVFAELLALVARLGADPPPMADLARWEASLLADLGYGLDLSACAVTGETADLAYVSPRTGRAVSDGAAGIWKARLLPLPRLLQDETDAGTAPEWRDALRATGHFLSRDAFGHQHRPLPQAREALYHRISDLAGDSTHDV